VGFPRDRGSGDRDDGCGLGGLFEVERFGGEEEGDKGERGRARTSCGYVIGALFLFFFVLEASATVFWGGGLYQVR
jgi:hypothetical protein